MKNRRGSRPRRAVYATLLTHHAWSSTPEARHCQSGDQRSSNCEFLFTTGNAYLPQIAGGAQSSTHQLATELKKHGHDPAVLCKLQGGGWTELRARVNKRLTRKLFARDERMGYPVFRAWDPTAATEVAERFRPEVAVVQNGQTMKIATSFEASGIPVVLYFRNVEFDELGGNPADLRLASYISNSQFTATRYKEAFGVSSTVIPPLIDESLYRTTSSQQNVTFINPYPVKGVDLAIEIARRCSDIPFSFNESWALNNEYKKALSRRLQELPNVALCSRTDDMRSVYGKARVVLMPSKWEEAWGRVASEAQFSGFPCSDRSVVVCQKQLVKAASCWSTMRHWTTGLSVSDDCGMTTPATLRFLLRRSSIRKGPSSTPPTNSPLFWMYSTEPRRSVVAGLPKVAWLGRPLGGRGSILVMAMPRGTTVSVFSHGLLDCDNN